jgi:hypothetical protein
MFWQGKSHFQKTGLTYSWNTIKELFINIALHKD